MMIYLNHGNKTRILYLVINSKKHLENISSDVFKKERKIKHENL